MFNAGNGAAQLSLGLWHC